MEEGIIILPVEEQCEGEEEDAGGSRRRHHRHHDLHALATQLLARGQSGGSVQGFSILHLSSSGKYASPLSPLNAHHGPSQEQSTPSQLRPDAMGGFLQCVNFIRGLLGWYMLDLMEEFTWKEYDKHIVAK